VDWVFSPKARDSIRDSTARLNIWHGSVRSGKTISSIIRWLEFISTAPRGGHLVMVGKTERTLRRNILSEVEKIVGARQYHYNAGEGVATILGREVFVYGANDERAEGKIRGLTVAGAYGDELSLWPESFYRQLLARMSARGAMMFGTTNPDGPYHWLKTGFIDRADTLNLRAFHFGLDDNPALDPAYVDSLKAEYVPGSLWYKRFIEGLWVAAEGAVYDFFNEAEHTLTSLPDSFRPDGHWISIDYGTSNATSAGLYGAWRKAAPGDLSAVRLDGYYYDGRATGRQKTDSEYAADLGEKFGEWKGKAPIILDPSAASFKQELRRTGWKVIDADNSVIDGIRTQAKMLHNGEYKLLNTPGNRQAIRDYGAYLWDTRAQARGEDKPIKQNDHTKDEERYFLQTVFGKSVQPSDRARRALSGW